MTTANAPWEIDQYRALTHLVDEQSIRARRAWESDDLVEYVAALAERAWAELRVRDCFAVRNPSWRRWNRWFRSDITRAAGIVTMILRHESPAA